MPCHNMESMLSISVCVYCSIRLTEKQKRFQRDYFIGKHRGQGGAQTCGKNTELS
jgi:hypothetical protein